MIRATSLKVRRSRAILLLASLIASVLAIPILPAFATSPVLENAVTCSSSASITYTCSMNTNAVGETIAVFASVRIDTTGRPYPYTVKVNSSGVALFQLKSTVISTCFANNHDGICGGTNGTYWYAAESLWIGTANASGASIPLTVTVSTGSLYVEGAAIYDMADISAQYITQGVANVGWKSDSGNPIESGNGISGLPGIQIMGLTAWSSLVSAVAGCSFVNVGVAMAGAYQTIAAGPYTGCAINFTGLSGHETGYASITALFVPAIFTCTITNMDGGNYVVANGKFYDFQCIAQSDAVSGSNDPITTLQVQFNDSVHTITAQWQNGTGFTVINGGSYITLSASGSVSFLGATSAGVTTLTVNFEISATPGIIDSLKRGIQLYAENSVGASYGFVYVQTKYFNIYDQGGSVTLLDQGLCAVPSGADTFQTICQYNSSPSSWIAENTTFYHLQQFQGLFSIKLTNNTGLPESAFWMDYGHSGSGTNPSSNPGDWKIDVGFFTWDNSSATCCWVKTIHAIISMQAGAQGSNNEWTEFKVGWFDGSTLIANDTFNAWIEQTPLSQVTLWVNLWYSQNNSSTSEGGEVQAYYTGMHNSGYLWWSSWSPFLQNDSTTSIYVPLKNSAGSLMSSNLAQFTRVYMNMSRPGAPAKHAANQVNFQVQTRAFQIETFSTTGLTSPMASVDTPAFAPVVVPIIQNTGGFFSPLINALKTLAGWIANAFVAIGSIVWAGLGARFPWFTSFWGSVGGALVSFFNLFTAIIGGVITILTFMFSIAGDLLTPFTIIGGTFSQIETIYAHDFGGLNISQVVTLFILVVFGLSIFEAAATGDIPFLIRMARQAWGIANAILQWTWQIIKMLIDTVEGLIP